MNFAKNILSKYGWQEGDGLGKDKQGIKRPIKANLKFDQAGLGSDPSEEFRNNWWERVFNEAAENVLVRKERDGEITLNLKDGQNSVEVTTKSYSVKKLAEKGTMYGNKFLSEGESFSNFTVTEYKAMTDEELFRACGGRTAHKGARHGLKLSGKLARIEQQEKDLLAQMKAKALGTKQDSEINEDNAVSDIRNETSLKNPKRKRKCFSETPSHELTTTNEEPKKKLFSGNNINESEDDARLSKITKIQGLSKKKKSKKHKRKN